MIDIKVKYDPGFLARLALLIPGAKEVVAEAATKSWYEDTMSWIADKKAYTVRTGALNKSIGYDKTRVFAEMYYSGFVESGTIKARPFPYLIIDVKNRMDNLNKAASIALRKHILGV